MKTFIKLTLAAAALAALVAVAPWLVTCACGAAVVVIPLIVIPIGLARAMKG